MEGEVELKTVLWKEEDGAWWMRFEATRPEEGQALRAFLDGTPSHRQKNGKGAVRNLVLIRAHPVHPRDSQPIYFDLFEGYE